MTTPDRGLWPAAPLTALPDLIVLVRRELRDGQTRLYFTLVHRVAPPEGNFEELGPVVLEREPRAYFQALFEDVETLEDAGPAPADLARRLAGKGARLFRELLPEPLRRRFWQMREQTRTVQIFSDEPWIPWELLKLKGESGEPGPFFGEAFAITRWLRGTREAALLPLRYLALVVPRGTGLRHAEAERRFLLEQQARGRRVDEIPARAAAVADALAKGAHDGWHFTGHGTARGGDPQRWRLLLEEDEALQPDDLYDQADLWERRPLVFLNGCQTARGGFALTGLGGWAQDFFRAGAGAFLGTYWEVQDEPALVFAQAFYGELFGGVAAGEAARRARLAVRDRFPGDPSWLAYTLFAHPQAVCPRCHAFDPRADVAPAIRREIHDFSRLLVEKTAGFVGREWVFAEIDRFLAANPRGYFLLQGEPGIGKSSLLAELVRRHGWVHHFNLRAEGLQSAEDFLRNVCAQLIAAFGLDYPALPPEVTAKGQFLEDLLERVAAHLAPGEKAVVVVDALDEAERDLSSPGANDLFLPSRLPPGVYLVVSTRPGARLRLDVEQRTFEIRQDDADNLADVRELVTRRLSPSLLAYIAAQRLDQAAFVEEMVRRSQGNFMYLRYVLPELESGGYQDFRFDRLPEGLERYYEDHWRRMRGRDEEAWFAWKLPVLEALTVVQEPVSARLLARFAGVDDPRRVHAVLRQWREFLYETEAEDPQTGERQKRYRLYHASFQEFVAAKDELREERVRLKDRHGKIADVLWEDLFGAQEEGP